MTEDQIRLECLRIAVTRGANDVRPLQAIADEYYAWVKGDNGVAPDAPTPDYVAGQPETAPMHARKSRREPDASG